MALSGNAGSVSGAGGWLASGGNSAMRGSRLYGLGVDQVLQMEVRYEYVAVERISFFIVYAKHCSGLAPDFYLHVRISNSIVPDSIIALPLSFSFESN